MLSRTSSSAALALALLFLQAQAAPSAITARQSTTNPTRATSSTGPAGIVGCTEVGCPAPASCQVASSNFTAVGATAIQGALPAQLAGLSWTVGVDAQQQLGADGGTVFQKSFLLGGSASATAALASSSSSGGGCAVFFSNVSASVKFPDGASVETDQGTCSDAMSAACVGALVARARAVDVDASAVVESCERLRLALEDNLDDQCKGFATGDKWSGLLVQPITGTNASHAISSAQNASSNCWPTLPKSNDLTVVETIQTTGDSTVNSILQNVYGITPILTLFFSGSKDTVVTSSDNSTTAQLTCIKAMGPSSPASGTISPGDSGDDGDDEPDEPTMSILPYPGGNDSK